VCNIVIELDRDSKYSGVVLWRQLHTELVIIGANDLSFVHLDLLLLLHLPLQSFALIQRMIDDDMQFHFNRNNLYGAIIDE
jgi:hypothetical protein